MMHRYGSTTKSREVAVGFKGDEKFYKVRYRQRHCSKKRDESHKSMMESLNDLFDKNDDFKNAFVVSKDNSIATDFLVAGFMDASYDIRFLRRLQNK